MCTCIAHMESTFANTITKTMKDMENDITAIMKRVEIIKHQISGIYNILKRSKLGTDESHVILLLISLYKDDQISKDFLYNQDKVELTEMVSDWHTHYKNAHSDYQPIIEAFRSSLLKLSEGGFENIIDHLFQIDKMTLKENFKDIFETILYQVANSQGKSGGGSMQPLELTRFICNLADLPKNSKVFNPFAGLASFGVYLDESQDYFGKELNDKNWALGVLRLMAHGKLENSNYACVKFTSNWADESQKFDLVVSTPPFRMLVSEPYRDGDKQVIQPVEQFLIEKGVNSLNNKGKLIALLPQSILSGGGQELKLRKYLIEKDLVDTIITLPGGLLFNTGISSVILFINKEKKTPGRVRFVDAGIFVESKDSREKVLDDNGLNELLQKTYRDSESVRLIDNDIIKEFDYNLSVHRYFIKKEIEGTKLRDILEHIKGNRNDLPDKGRLIRIRDLKDDKINFNLACLSVEEISFGKRRLRLIDESCLLLATVWKALKPTYFEFSGSPIYLNHDILAFRVDETKVDTAYLINELHAEYVVNQIISYRSGDTISRIRREDLLDVVIKLPSLKEQKAKVEGVLEISDKIKDLKKQRDDLAHGIDLKSYESFASIKHSLGKPLLSIGSSLRNIEHALFKLHKEWEKLKLDESFDITLRDTFDSMHSNITKISSILKNNDTEIDLSKKPLIEIDFLKFIRSFVKNVRTAQQSNVDIKLNVHPDIKNELQNKIMMNGNTELLDIAFNNIVENAEKHGFTDNNKQYMLEFYISLLYEHDSQKKATSVSNKSDTFVKIEVSNNGNPFPDKYTLEKLVRKNSYAGVTGNSGQGGYELNEIIKRHNDGKSTLDLITNDSSSEYTTTYLFLLPLNN